MVDWSNLNKKCVICEYNDVTHTHNPCKNLKNVQLALPCCSCFYLMKSIKKDEDIMKKGYYVGVELRDDGTTKHIIMQLEDVFYHKTIVKNLKKFGII